MKLLTHGNINAQKIFLFFSGFAGNPSFFPHFYSSSSGLILISNYQHINLNLDFLKDKSITLFAWSMGVAVAERLFFQKHSSLSFLAKNITQKIAINGTPQGIHKLYGIPPAFFKLTIKNFCLQDFCQNTFEQHLPLTNTFAFDPNHILQTELKFLFSFCSSPVISSQWDLAFISTQDKIFNPQAQERGWKDHCKKITKISSPHYPFFDFPNLNDFLQ